MCCHDFTYYIHLQIHHALGYRLLLKVVFKDYENFMQLEKAGMSAEILKFCDEKLDFINNTLYIIDNVNLSLADTTITQNTEFNQLFPILMNEILNEILERAGLLYTFMSYPLKLRKIVD